MYEANSQKEDQFWLNIGLMILIAGLFVAGLYYYQEKQLTEMKEEIENLEAQLTNSEDHSTSNNPAGNSTDSEISQEEIITSGPRDLPRIALTFDADMSSGMKKQEVRWYDPKIIEILKEEQIPATFFLTGMWAETYPEVTKQLANNGLFEIENHSYQTKSFSQPCYGLTPLSSKEEKVEVIQKAQQTIKEITNTTPNYFRFPGGCYQEQDLQLVNESGLRAVQWDVVSGDAFANNASSIVNKTLSNTRNGSIIVFHLGGPNAPHTAQAIKEIIPKLEEEGFKFVTLQSLLDPPSVSPVR
ncbi:MAG: polysaccharide deacetylase family protein [Candidatus Paceibacterota bacterium]